MSKQGKGQRVISVQSTARCTDLLMIVGKTATNARNGGLALTLPFSFSLCKLMDGSLCMSKVTAMKALIPMECMREGQNA